MARRVLAIALLAAAAQAAGAQIIDAGGSGRRFGQPNSWVSLGIGWMDLRGLCDPGSNSCWNFGNAPQWRASLEYPIGRGATIGGTASTARVPLTYQSQTVCFSGCDADANVSQYMAQLHLGGGTGIQQAIDVAAGITSFTNFRSADTGTRLAPMKAVSNFSFAVSYGLAIPLRPNFHVTLNQDYGQIVGKRMPGQSRNTTEQSVTRLGVRVGLGL